MASCCFIWKYAQVFKRVPFQVIRMTAGFGPFELPICVLLQRRRDHSPPEACFYLRSPALGWLSQRYEFTVTKRNGGGAEWVELL